MEMFESDDDTDTEIQDLAQLEAVLEEDQPSNKKTQVSNANEISASKYEEYTKIETAIALNKLTDDKLSRLENLLLEKLKECRCKLQELRNIEKVPESFDKVETFRYVNCSKPYFKDKNSYEAPANEDTLLMKKADMYNFSCISSVTGWTINDKSQFMKQMLKVSKEIHTSKLKSQITQIRTNKSKLPDSELELKINSIKKKINAINKMSIKELALPIDEEYDWDEVANALSKRHGPYEYRSLWKLFLHPLINKDCWSKAEHMKLQQITQDHNLQDWAEIAKQLNTKRTEYQCFVYYRTNMSNTFLNQVWTKEEVEYLKRLIDYYKEGDYIPWGRVSASMENRTKIQVYNKYMRLIELRKGRFLPEEDAVILNGVEKYGNNFKLINTFLPMRSKTQLKKRYQVLSKNAISIVWTVAEDKKLIQLMANQDSTTNYSSISRHFRGKDRVHIRARYKTLIKWMQRNPNVDLKHAPRRGARRLLHGQAADNLNNAVENLKTRMEKEVDKKKSNRITKRSSEDDIDDAILAFFVTEHIRESEKTIPELEESFSGVDNSVIPLKNINIQNLKRLLILLKAQFNRETFQESMYAEDYSELLKDNNSGIMRYKSYSKKSRSEQVFITNDPDIWGNNMLQSTEYTLPPHLANITGCKALINHITQECVKSDINHMKRHPEFKEQMYIFLNRFNLLFLWPMLLSNEVPPKPCTEETKRSCTVQSKESISVLNGEMPKSYHFKDEIEKGTKKEETADTKK